jgi:hypothetical protein
MMMMMMMMMMMVMILAHLTRWRRDGMKKVEHIGIR